MGAALKTIVMPLSTVFTRRSAAALIKLPKCGAYLSNYGNLQVKSLLHLGQNIVTFRTLLHLGQNVITFRVVYYIKANRRYSYSPTALRRETSQHDCEAKVGNFLAKAQTNIG